MRRKLNIKLVACVGGVLFVAGVCVHFLHGYQVGRHAYVLRELADRAVEARDDDRALACYAQYLAFAPNDADSLQKYVEVLERRADAGDRVRLVLQMEQVLRAKPGEHALRLRLVHNLIALDRIPEAAGNLKKLLNSSLDRAEVLHMLGWCQDATKDYPQAVRSFEEAIRLQPKQIKTYALLAEVLHERLHQPDDARKVMDDLVKHNADAYQAYLSRAQFQRRRGDDNAAQSDLQRAFALAPDRPEVILACADAERARGNWAAAAKLLQDGSTRHPGNIEFYRQLAEVKARAGKYDEAVAHVQAGLQRDPKSTQLAVILIDLLIDQHQYADARARIDALDKAVVRPGLPSYLQARLAAANKHWHDAIRLLHSAQTDLGAGSPWSSRVHALFGYCYRQIGERERELQAYRRAVQDEPTSTIANVGLGSALLRSNRIDEANETLEPLRTTTDLPVGYWLLLSQARFARQMKRPDAERLWDGLEESLERAVKADAASPAPATLRGDMFVVRRQYAEAIAAYTHALDQGATQPRVLASLMNLLLQRGEFAQADAAFVKHTPKVTLTPDLARLGAEAARNPKIAVQRAEQAVPLPPRDYRDALWLARIYRAASENAKAESVLRAALADADHVPDLWVVWMEHLHQTSQRDLGVQELDRLKHRLPHHLQPLTIARCYDALSMPKEAEKAYQDVLQNSPGDYVALAHAADFHRRAGHIEQARKLYERLLDPALAAPADYTAAARRQLETLRGKSS